MYKQNRGSQTHIQIDLIFTSIPGIHIERRGRTHIYFNPTEESLYRIIRLITKNELRTNLTPYGWNASLWLLCSPEVPNV